jgi:hypothetical protein
MLVINKEARQGKVRQDKEVRLGQQMKAKIGYGLIRIGKVRLSLVFQIFCLL